jgi:hypothetical protein
MRGILDVGPIANFQATIGRPSAVFLVFLEQVKTGLRMEELLVPGSDDGGKIPRPT